MPDLLRPDCPPDAAHDHRDAVPSQCAAMPIAAFADALMAREMRCLVGNVTADVAWLGSGGLRVPVTIGDGTTGGSYVTDPHSAFGLYPLEEARLLTPAPLRWAVRGGLRGLSAGLRLGAINRVVQIDNLPLSTNLHDPDLARALPDVRAAAQRRWPRHAIALRNISDWHQADLLAAARDNGWILVPARQIWVIDDLARDWVPRNNHANDRRALRKSGLMVSDLESLSPADARRIAQLHQGLFRGRHSQLNPDYTADFMQAAQSSGLLRFRVARDPKGTIMAAVGMLVRDGVMTVPVLGYDLAAPAQAGLYRIASYLYLDRALALGVRLNGSSGAGHFKRQRGARGIIEYTAFYVAHLPWHRRMTVHVLNALMRRVAVPALIARGL